MIASKMKRMLQLLERRSHVFFSGVAEPYFAPKRRGACPVCWGAINTHRIICVLFFFCVLAINPGITTAISAATDLGTTTLGYCFKLLM